MRKYIGNKQFYKMVLLVAIPIMVQNGITNFVGMLDNIMVGQVGTPQMSGVAIINQLLLVFNITIFGAVSGAGIFGAQYYGCKDYEGVRNAFRYKLLICIGIVVLSIAIFIFGGESLIELYLDKEAGMAERMETLRYAKDYLLAMLPGLLPFALEQAYSATLRESGETLLPMKAGIISVLVNLVLNYIFIFGNFGFPKMGVVGAAIATVISRYIGVMIVVSWTHRHLNGSEKANKRLERLEAKGHVCPYPYMKDVYKQFKVPKYLFIRITKKATPLLINEAMWAMGMAMLLQCYSIRGLSVIAAFNISNTIGNVFNIVSMSLGSAIAIIVGQMLGAGKLDEAKSTAGKLIAFSSFANAVIGVFLIAVSGVFPQIYNTTDDVKQLATSFICVVAVLLPLMAFTNGCYFTLRSGGKTIITFLFDSVFVWGINIPVTFILSRYTTLPIIPLYFFCQSLELIKCISGYILVKKGIWIQNMTKQEE